MQRTQTQDIMKGAEPICFYKMHGSGNDFVLLLNDELQVPKDMMQIWASKICDRFFGVGADGLIFLESAAHDMGIDYRWHFYNSDGSRAEMCGNGSRCAAWLAYELGLADKSHVLGTDVGPVQARVLPEQDLVKVLLTKPRDLSMHLDLVLPDQQLRHVHFVDTGVPHVVYITGDADQLAIQELGPQIRYHKRFAPKGTNVNLVSLRGPDRLYVRTYERGVEAETLACGTGAAAAAVVARELGLCSDQVHITTSGNEELTIFLDQGLVYLQGPAVLVFTGYLNPRTVQLAKQGLNQAS